MVVDRERSSGSLHSMLDLKFHNYDSVTNKSYSYSDLIILILHFKLNKNVMPRCMNYVLSPACFVLILKLFHISVVSVHVDYYIFCHIMLDILNILCLMNPCRYIPSC